MTRGVRSRRPGCRATATDISPKDLEPPLIALKTLNERSRKISILRISAPPISFFIPFSNLSFPFSFSRLVSSRRTSSLQTISLSPYFIFYFFSRARLFYANRTTKFESSALPALPSPRSPPHGRKTVLCRREGRKRKEKK